jgi:hypothetical protein
VALALGGTVAEIANGGTGPAQAASSPASYLLGAQNSDGGLGSAPGQASSQLYSGWAALGLSADAINPQHVSRGGSSLTEYLARGVRSLHDPGSLERTILAAQAAGLPASSFGGRNLVAALERDFRHDGSIAEQTNLTSFAVLALRAAGRSPPPTTSSWLVRQHDRDGGYNYSTRGGMSDPDDTGAALEALAAVPGAAASNARAGAVAYLERHQDRDGGFPSFPGAGSNAQSTAWAIQGLIAAGVNPSSLHRGGAPSPVQYLRSLIAPDGHVRYSRTSNQTPVWVTGEALMALAGKALPLRAPVSSTPHPGSSQSAAQHPAKPTTAHVSRTSGHSSHPRQANSRVAAARGPNDQLVGYLALADAIVLAPVGLG